MQLHSQNKSKLIILGSTMWAIAAIFYGLDYLQHTIPSVLIEPIAKNIGIHYTNIATIMSVYFPVYAISQIPAGYLIDRYGTRRTMSAACFAVSTGLLLMLMSSVLSILLGRILIAMGSAFAFIGTLKTVSIWFPKRYFSFFVGITQSIGVIGGLTGQVFIDHLIITRGWQRATFDVALFGIAWSLVLLLFLKSHFKQLKNTPGSTLENNDDEHHKSYTRKGKFSEIIRDKNIWYLAIYAAIMVGIVMSTFAELYDVVFLQKSLHIDSQQATYITMFIFIGVGIGAPLHGIISNFFNKQRTWMIICTLATFVIFLLMPTATILVFNQLTLIIIYFALGFFVSSMLLAFSIARCCYPYHSHGIIFAFINTIIGLAGFLFPLLFAELIKLISFYSHLSNELLVPLFLLAALLSISFILSLLVKEG